MGVPKRSFFKVITESTYTRLDQEQKKSKKDWIYYTKRYAFTRSKMMSKMSRRDKNRNRLYFMFWILGSRFDKRVRFYITFNLGASLPKKINLYVVAFEHRVVHFQRHSNANSLISLEYSNTNTRYVGCDPAASRARNMHQHVLTVRVSPAMKVGEFLELCMRYDEMMNLLNWHIMDRPVSIFRSTFDLNFGVQNRMHTTKIAVISSAKDWISSAKEYESNWYCLNQRLWDVGVRNGDLIEYRDGDENEARISLTSKIWKYDRKVPK